MVACCMRITRLVACVAIVALTRTAAAQTDTTIANADTAGTHSLCWKPRPAPTCRAYLPTEFAYEHPLASTWIAPGAHPNMKENDFGRRFVLAMGLMRNRGTKSALGGLVALSTDDREVFGLLRAEGRYRRWIGSRAGVDLGLGLAQMSVYTEGYESVKARGLTAGVGLDFQYFGVDARIDRLRGGGRPRNGAFVGVHAGSQAGLAAVGVALSAFAIVIIAWIVGS